MSDWPEHQKLSSLRKEGDHEVVEDLNNKKSETAEKSEKSFEAIKAELQTLRESISKKKDQESIDELLTHAYETKGTNRKEHTEFHKAPAQVLEYTLSDTRSEKVKQNIALANKEIENDVVSIVWSKLGKRIVS